MNFEGLDRAVSIAKWCSVCNSDEATNQIEIEINDNWVELPICSGCLTSIEAQGRLDM